MPDKNYDLEKVYDEKIHPLMEMIAGICREHNIPFVTSFQYSYQIDADGEESHGVCSSVGMPADREIAPVLANMQSSIRTFDDKDVDRDTLLEN